MRASRLWRFAFVAGLVAAALVAAPEPVRAQRIYFNPEIILQVFYTDNPVFLGEGETDTYGRLIVVLPVRREFKLGGSIEAIYSPAIEQYRRRDDFDNLSHRFQLNFVARTAEHTSLSMFARYTRTQEQGRLRSVEDIDLFLTPRLDREIYRAGVNYSRKVTERWRFGLFGGYLRYEFETIRNLGQGLFNIGVADREGYIGRASATYDFSRATQIGLLYGWERYTFGAGGHDTTQLAAFTLRHSFTERLWMDFQIGVFRTTGRDASGRDVSRDGGYGAIGITRAFRRVNLRLFARHRPSPGGALPGPSTDTVVGLLLYKAHVRRWRWELLARYAQRDSIDPTLELIESWAYGGEIEYIFHRLLSLRLEALYTDQTGPAFLEAEFYRVGFSLIWTPLGRTRLGGGTDAVPRFEGE